MRIFLAVDLDESIRSGIAALQRHLAREGVPGIRWVDPAGIHLTLRFCGEISQETTDRLARSIAPGVPYAPFPIRLGGLGTFPPRGAPRVLWVGVREAGSLVPVAAWIEERVISCGLSREPRPFHPHLTLGRFRPGARPPVREALSAPGAGDLGSLTVETIVLFESHLSPGGARYDALHSFPLTGAGG